MLGLAPWSVTGSLSQAEAASLRSRYFECRRKGGENWLHRDRLVVLGELQANQSAQSKDATPSSASGGFFPQEEGGLVAGKENEEISSCKNFGLSFRPPGDSAFRRELNELVVPPSRAFLLQSEPLLTMRKIDRDNFLVAFQHPFTMLQAFGICLSRFDTKQRY